MIEAAAMAMRSSVDEVEAASSALMEAVEGVRVYTERQLARKCRLEQARLPEIEETAMPRLAADYLARQQVMLLVESARLTKLQASLLGHLVEGWQLADISREYGIPYTELVRRYRILRRKIEAGGSPYDGLYEVYWREVHRHVYRKGK
jgi:hypothetical protein